MNEHIQSGFIEGPRQLGDFVHGDGKLGTLPLQPSGDWSAFLPPDNIQNRNGFEPRDCVSQATLGCVEILARHEYTDTDNWSRRLLATVSGTGVKGGNDPQSVSEALRKGGCVYETDLPFAAPDLPTFYQTISNALIQLAAYTFRKYQYGHSWVNANPADMIDALTYSPLSAAGYAWQFDTQTGYAITPVGSAPGHDFVVYNCVKEQYWCVWDSYLQVHKKLAWNYTFSSVKRHTLHRVINTDASKLAPGSVNWPVWISVVKRWLGL